MRPPRLLRRAGRRTNIALLVVLVGAFASGVLAFAVGTPGPARVTTVAHGVFGVGVVLLIPWKSVVVSRSARLHPGSLALIALVAICLAAGFVQVFGGYGVVLGVTPIQVHVGAALVAVPLLTWHVVRHRRRQGLRRRDLSRRTVLRTGLLGVGAAAGWVVLETAGRAAGSGSARRIATGSHRLDAAAIPATTWLLDRVPDLGPRHRVAIAGHAWTAAQLDELAQAEGLSVAARLDCTSGWYADAVWTAVPLDRLLPTAGDGPPDRARGSIEVVSATGYRRRFPPAQAGSLWLATRRDGGLLTAGTGSPVRLVVPHRRGFWWVKWVAEVRVSPAPAWAQPPFPLQ